MTPLCKVSCTAFPFFMQKHILNQHCLFAHNCMVTLGEFYAPTSPSTHYPPAVAAALWKQPAPLFRSHFISWPWSPLCLLDPGKKHTPIFCNIPHRSLRTVFSLICGHSENHGHGVKCGWKELQGAFKDQQGTSEWHRYFNDREILLKWKDLGIFMVMT